MIDLRSDTVTRPSDAMRKVMASAQVGDDVYGDDPSVKELEAHTAEILGKEDAVFVPTGTMSNQIAVRTFTEPGDLILIHEAAHIVRAEAGGAAALSGVTVHPLPGPRGIFSPDDVHAAIEEPHPFNPTTLATPTRLLCLENTHNGGGGSVWPLDRLHSVCEAGRSHGLALHLDGARLWHATAASGVSERDFAAPFDTVNVCFSKGLGAPVGSALAGDAETIGRARRFKQQFGGGFRQAGILAAAALYALEHHRDDLVRDVRNARAFARGLAELEGLDVDPDAVDSNIVRFRVTAMPAGLFATRCHEHGVHMLPNGAHGMRAVVHRDVDGPELEWALAAMRRVIAEVADGDRTPVEQGA